MNVLNVGIAGNGIYRFNLVHSFTWSSRFYISFYLDRKMSNLNHNPIIKNIPLKDIKPYSNNPRKKQNITKVVNVMKRDFYKMFKSYQNNGVAQPHKI